MKHKQQVDRTWIERTVLKMELDPSKFIEAFKQQKKAKLTKCKECGNISIDKHPLEFSDEVQET